MAKKKAARKQPTPPAAPRAKSGARPAGSSVEDNRARAAERREAAAKRRSKATLTRSKLMKVRATKLGFYGLVRRRRGDVFVLESESHFSSKWMVKVDTKTPLRTSVAKDEMKREHDRVLADQLGIEVEDDGNPDDLDDNGLNPLDV